MEENSNSTEVIMPPPPPRTVAAVPTNERYSLPEDLSSYMTARQIGELSTIFRQFDDAKVGAIVATELSQILKQFGFDITNDVAQARLKSLGIHTESSESSCQILYADFARLLHTLRSDREVFSDELGLGSPSPKEQSQQPQLEKTDSWRFEKIDSRRLRSRSGSEHRQVQVSGETNLSTHSYAQEEKRAFAAHINNILAKDIHMGPRLPIDMESDALFEACADGVLFCKLINMIEKDTVDERCLNLRNGGLSIYHRVENLNLAINAARSVGCLVVNVGAHDIMQGNPILILGLVWQLIKLELLQNISVKQHPELVRLLLDGEELDVLLALSPEKILIRWVNFHLEAANSSRRIQDFGPALQDCEVYSSLLHHLNPAACPLIVSTNPSERAQDVLSNASALGSVAFLQHTDITNGNRKLNMAFVAQIFHQCPGLAIPSPDEAMQLGLPMSFATLDDDLDVGDSREERTFRNWINSLDIEGVFLSDLYSGIGADLNLLKVMDKVRPGVVDWKVVNKNTSNRFKLLENMSYALKLAKEMDLVVVNMGAQDILEKNKKLILALMWQMMRQHTFQLLANLAENVDSVSEDSILHWANSQVALAERSSSMASFKDPSLSNALFLIDLCFSIAPNAVYWDIVKDGETEEEKLNNAKYVISIARKIGACVFIVPEDIVEIRPRLLMTFVASLWATSLEKSAENRNAKFPTNFDAFKKIGSTRL